MRMATNAYRPLLAGVFLLVVGLSGCVASDPGEPADTGAEADMDTAPGEEWALHLSGCDEGGFVALYGLSTSNPHGVGEGYTRADVSSEMGDPMMNSMEPRDDGSTGNWHQGFRCAEAHSTAGGTAEDYIFGYVGVWAEPPEWDVGGADVHVVLAGFGFEPGDIRDSLMEVTMADITEAESAVIDWYVPPTADAAAAAYTEYFDVQKGDYYSYGELHNIGDAPERTIRFWWAVPTDGTRADIGAHAHDEDESAEHYAAPHEHGYHPVWFDLTTQGAAHYAAEGSDALSCHGGTDDHGPQGFLCQPTTTNVYLHDGDLTLTYGGIIKDVVVEEVWMH